MSTTDRVSVRQPQPIPQAESSRAAAERAADANADQTLAASLGRQLALGSSPRGSGYTVRSGQSLPEASRVRRSSSGSRHQTVTDTQRGVSTSWVLGPSRLHVDPITATGRQWVPKRISGRRVAQHNDDAVDEADEDDRDEEEDPDDKSVGVGGQRHLAYLQQTKKLTLGYRIPA